MNTVVCTIAGSDSSGGAGIQADLKTFSAVGVYGATVITAITAQNTTGVYGKWNLPTEYISKQMDSVFSDLTVKAVKIGVLSNLETIEAVGEGIKRWCPKNIVLDPVMVSASGAVLVEKSAHMAVIEKIFPLVDIITPNLFEASVLTNTAVAKNQKDILLQAKALLALGAKSVLVKGGHSGGPESNDLFCDANGETLFRAPRCDTLNTHGTGCTLSSAIAAALAMDYPMTDAVQYAKEYITAAIEAGAKIRIGKGTGPVCHAHGSVKKLST